MCISLHGAPVKFDFDKCILVLTMYLEERQMLSLLPLVTSQQPHTEDDVLIPSFC